MYVQNAVKIIRQLFKEIFYFTVTLSDFHVQNRLNTIEIYQTLY